MSRKKAPCNESGPFEDSAAISRPDLTLYGQQHPCRGLWPQPKAEIPNPKWLDKLAILSDVEGQIQMTKTQNNLQHLIIAAAMTPNA